MVCGVTGVIPHRIFKHGLSGFVISYYFDLPSHITELKLVNMRILPTSERMGRADRLLTEAKQLLEDYEGSIGLDERMTAEGMLAT